MIIAVYAWIYKDSSVLLTSIIFFLYEFALRLSIVFHKFLSNFYSYYIRLCLDYVLQVVCELEYMRTFVQRLFYVFLN